MKSIKTPKQLKKHNNACKARAEKASVTYPNDDRRRSSWIIMDHASIALRVDDVYTEQGATLDVPFIDCNTAYDAFCLDYFEHVEYLSYFLREEVTEKKQRLYVFAVAERFVEFPILIYFDAKLWDKYLPSPELFGEPCNGTPFQLFCAKDELKPAHVYAWNAKKLIYDCNPLAIVCPCSHN